MKRFLNTTGVGLTITNILWSSIGLLLVGKIILTKSEAGWPVISITLFLNLILSFSLGELIERFETLYLKGKILSSGKYTIDK